MGDWGKDTDVPSLLDKLECDNNRSILHTDFKRLAEFNEHLILNTPTSYVSEINKVTSNRQ